MDIKIEPEDDVTSSNTSDNAHKDNKMEDIKHKIHFTEFSIDNPDSKENVLNIKLEEDNVEWEKYKNDVLKDDALLKMQNLDEGGSLNAQTTTVQFTSIKTSSNNPPIITNRERDVKNETEHVVVVPIVLLEKSSFFLQNYVCHICFRMFSSFPMLKEHKFVHNEIILNIEYQKGTQVSEKLLGHNLKSNLSTQTKLFKCDRCNYKSALSYSLKTHMMTHTSEKPYKCDVCEYKSTKSSDVKTHKMKHSGEKPFQCDQCAYKTVYSFHLKTHRMQHSGEKPFQCNQCSFKSVRSTDLKRHKMLHSGKKPYNCDVCSYKTAHYSHFKAHKLLHNSLTRFDCNVCELKGLRSIDLKRHMVVHSGGEFFKCDRCHYVSTRLVYLKRHRISHSGFKAFACDICDFKTAYACNLKTHKLSHSNFKSLICDQCEFKCESNFFLKRHKKTHLKARVTNKDTKLTI